MEPLYQWVITSVRTMFALQGLKFSMWGREHIPREGGAVMALNHTGYMDFTYAGNATIPTRRLVRYMAKDSVFRNPVAGPMMRGMKHIPVDRAHGAGSFREAVEALKRGEIVGVYPEATISRSFELKEFKTGAARMARDAQVPILPTIVLGAQRVWTKDHPKNLGRTNIPIYVEINPPLWVGAGEDVHAATERLRAAMSESLDRMWGKYPTLHGADLVYLPARFGGLAPTPEQAARMDAAERAKRAEKRRKGQPSDE